MQWNSTEPAIKRSGCETKEEKKADGMESELQKAPWARSARLNGRRGEMRRFLCAKRACALRGWPFETE